MCLAEAVEKATRWLERNRTNACWRIPVLSECVLSTALSLHVIDEYKKRQEIIDYLLAKGIWKESVPATSLFITALIDEDAKLAKAILKKWFTSSNECWKRQRSNVGEELKHLLSKEGFPPKPTSLSKIARRIYYLLLLTFTPNSSWSHRRSFLYDHLPRLAPFMLTSKGSSYIDSRLETALVEGLNKDGSYAGNTIMTIKSAYVLRQLGNEHYSKKAIRWLDKVYNGNGSFRPILYQDVYDSAWASLAISDANEKQVGSTVKWLESTKVDAGYPYYSYSYYPDTDDTSLVLFLKNSMNYFSKDDHASLDFLLKSQNPDGGWGFVSFFALSYNPFATLYKFALGLNNWASSYGLPLGRWEGQCLSTIDMTSRALITLTNFKENPNTNKALAKGVRYLLAHYHNGKFHTSVRWTDTDIFETSMALIALFRSGIHNKKTEEAISWMLNQNVEAPEDVAHLLWALIEGDIKEDKQRKLADMLVSKQLNDGSWRPKVCFFSGQTEFRSLVFSTAAPLYVLCLYQQRIMSRKK